MIKRKKRIPVWAVVITAVIMPSLLFGSYVAGSAYVEKLRNDKLAIEAKVKQQNEVERVENERKREEAFKASFDEQKIIDETNAYRGTKGLEPLARSEKLHQSACMKAQDMADKDYWAHIAPDGTEPWFFFKQVSYSYYAAGENLAYGYSGGKSLVGGWINSPNHEKNLVGNFTETGVCTVFAKKFQSSVHKIVDVTVAHYGKPR